MGLQLPATPWRLPDPADAPAGDDLFCIGGDLEPATLLNGYARGMFAMHVDVQDAPAELLIDQTSRRVGRDQELFDLAGSAAIGWWSPDPRGVLIPTAVHESRSLRGHRNRFTVTFDQAFAEVVRRCAAANRDGGWITGAFRDAYQRLHEAGWAHSVEVWNADDRSQLVGGLFGIELGGLFCAESKFSTVTDASKTAVVALARFLSADDGHERLIDTQWWTPHLGRLGASQVPRERYLSQLPRITALPPRFGQPSSTV